MVKWADFLISAVSYNVPRTHIKMVRVHQDQGDSVSGASEVERLIIVQNIEKGITYMTIFRGNTNKWKIGQEVRILQVGNEKYIRTDKDAIATDNLDKLPEF